MLFRLAIMGVLSALYFNLITLPQPLQGAVFIILLLAAFLPLSNWICNKLERKFSPFKHSYDLSHHCGIPPLESPQEEQQRKNPRY